MLWEFSRKILWNSIGVETAFSTHHCLVTTCPEIVFKTSCGIFMSAIQMRPTHQRAEADHDPLFLVRPLVDMMQRKFHTMYRSGKELSLDESMCPFRISIQSTDQEKNYLWMKACVLLRAESISSVTTPKSQTGSILNFLWSVNRALATFVALKFIQVMHLSSHRVMHRKYRMHQKLHALSYVG